ncbi:MAG: hypothetical protein ACPGGN_04675 [Opitutales bacterium]|jgi:hypothetical protein
MYRTALVLEVVGLQTSTLYFITGEQYLIHPGKDAYFMNVLLSVDSGKRSFEPIAFS